jgi:hypothetical protein
MIMMSRCKATEELAPPIIKKPNISKDFVYHMAARKGTKVYKVSPTKISKRPINKFLWVLKENTFHYVACCT